MGRYFKIVVLGLCLTAMSEPAPAQSTVTGGIAGTVIDPNKDVVPNATVIVRNVETGKARAVVTDGEGGFRIEGLQPGTYTVSFMAKGFNTSTVDRVLVEVGRVTAVGANLNVGLVPSNVQVNASMPVIDTAQQDFSTNVNQIAINELPINGRRWSNFALGAPATAPEGGFGLVSFHGISNLLNNNTVDGGDNNQAFFSEERGRSRIGYVIGLDSVREFQINNSNYSAEYGRAAGGVVNAITKSGTNLFHGSAFYYIRDSDWGARNPRGFQTVFANGVLSIVDLKPVDRRHQFGGTVGGPVIKNSLFFFFSFDQQKRNFPGIATPSDPAFFATVNRGTTGAGLKAPNRLLTDAQIDSTITFLTGLTGEVTRRGDQTIYLPKIDWHISDKHTLTATYNRMSWSSPGGIQTGATTSSGRQSFGDDFVDVDSLNLRLTSTFTDRLINEARFQYGRDNEFEFSQKPAPGEPLTGPHGRPPAIAITGGLNFGKPTFLERRAFPDEKRWQYADSTTLMRSEHTIKFGFDFNHVNDLLDSLFAEEGSYSYSTVNDFIMDYVNFTTSGSLRAAGRICSGSTRLAGQCYNGNFNQGFGPSAFRFTTNDYNFFVQDSYRMTPRLTLNIGLRYEYQQLPEPQIPNQLSNISGVTFGPEQTRQLPSDKNNLGPRLGFAYDLKGNGRTSLRGGYGIYYGRIINSTISNAITNTGATQSQKTFQLNVATATATAPVFPNTLISPAGTTAAPNIVLFDPNMQNPLVHEGDFVFERLVASNTVASASYIFSLGRDLPTFVDNNLPAPTARTYTIIGGDFNAQSVVVPFFAGPRPDPRFGAITVISSLTRSRYDALALQVNRRFTKGLQFDINYTLSKATDNGQTSTTFTAVNTPFNPLDLSVDQGLSNLDIRHKFSANIIWSPSFFAEDRKVRRAIFGGFTFSPIFIIASGSRYSAGTSGNPTGGVSGGLTGAGSALNRVPLFPRNSFRHPKIVNVDLRISRRFVLKEKVSLRLLAETFNLFNRTQVTGLNTRLYTIGGTATASTLTFDPAFQTLFAAGNSLARERQIQFAVRLEF